MVAGQRQEDVIEIGRFDRQAGDLDRARVEPVEEGPQGADPAVARDLQGERLAVAGRTLEGPGGPLELGRVGEREPDVAARHQPLQLVRRPFGDQHPVVEDRDPMRELVGLVEVLRRQEDRHAAGDEVPHGLPHHAAAARIEAGRGLIEEDDPRVADQGHREVETPLHAPGVGRDGLLGRLDQVEALEQLIDSSTALGLAEVPQVGHQLEVLLAGEELVDRGELAGDADDRADRVRLAGDVVAGDLDLAAIGGDQGREDPDRGRLAGAVRSEEREDRAFGDLEIDAVEDDAACRTTCAARSRGSRPGVRWPSCHDLPEVGVAIARIRCRGLPRRGCWAEPATMS